MEEKSHVFEKEVEQLHHSKSILEKENISPEELKTEFTSITAYYQQLLEETRLITSVSDRLQNKLNRANDKLIAQSDEIQNINTVLEKNNSALRHTIDELSKAKVSNKAITIVLIFAIVMFFALEGFIEPYIETRVESSWMGLLLKGVLFLLLKPVEMVVEKYLEKRASGKQKMIDDLLGGE